MRLGANFQTRARLGERSALSYALHVVRFYAFNIVKGTNHPLSDHRTVNIWLVYALRTNRINHWSLQCISSVMQQREFLGPGLEHWRISLDHWISSSQPINTSGIFGIRQNYYVVLLHSREFIPRTGHMLRFSDYLSPWSSNTPPTDRVSQTNKLYKWSN